MNKTQLLFVLLFLSLVGGVQIQNLLQSTTVSDLRDTSDKDGKMKEKFNKLFENLNTFGNNVKDKAVDLTSNVMDFGKNAFETGQDVLENGSDIIEKAKHTGETLMDIPLVNDIVTEAQNQAEVQSAIELAQRHGAQDELMAQVDFALWDKIKGIFGGKKPDNATATPPPANASGSGEPPKQASQLEENKLDPEKIKEMIAKAKAMAANFMAEESSDITCSNHQNLAEMLAESDSSGFMTTDGEVDLQAVLERCRHRKQTQASPEGGEASATASTESQGEAPPAGGAEGGAAAGGAAAGGAAGGAAAGGAEGGATGGAAGGSGGAEGGASGGAAGGATAAGGNEGTTGGAAGSTNGAAAGGASTGAAGGSAGDSTGSSSASTGGAGAGGAATSSSSQTPTQ